MSNWIFFFVFLQHTSVLCTSSCLLQNWFILYACPHMCCKNVFTIPFPVFFSANCKLQNQQPELETSLLFVDQDIVPFLCLASVFIIISLLCSLKEGWKLEIRQSPIVSKGGLHTKFISEQQFQDFSQPFDICTLSCVLLKIFSANCISSSGVLFVTLLSWDSLWVSRCPRPTTFIHFKPTTEKRDHLHAFPLGDIFELLGIFILFQKYWNIRAAVSLGVSRCPRPTTFEPTVCRDKGDHLQLQTSTPLQPTAEKKYRNGDTLGPVELIGRTPAEGPT